MIGNWTTGGTSYTITYADGSRLDVNTVHLRVNLVQPKTQTDMGGIRKGLKRLANAVFCGAEYAPKLRCTKDDGHKGFHATMRERPGEEPELIEWE